MCGICGVLCFNQAPVNLAAVLTVRERLAHRGPDDYGAIAIAVNDIQPPLPFRTESDLPPNLPPYSIALAHRRLSIIDLSAAGHQPMTNHERNLTISFNGEIYNYKELRQQLVQKGHQFHSQTDTEVILQAYLEWGVDCVQRFNGMFAFALWDHRNQTLFCARDRFGKKPFYYYLAADNRLFAFASELTALVHYPGIPQRINPAALNGYLALGYILAPHSWYEDIYKLEPAHYLLVNYAQRTVSQHLYWRYEACFAEKSWDTRQQAAETVLALLSQAVQRRLVADVPVGAFLSGGLDSSAVAVLAQRHHSQPLQTFSMGFNEATYNELPAAQRLAHWAKLHHHPVICEATPEQIAQAVGAFDEPFADNSLIPLFLLSAVTAQHLKVVLSGDGADEIFAGYPTYPASKIQHYAQVIPAGLKQRLWSLLNRIPPPTAQKLGLHFKLKQFLYGSQCPENQAHYCWRLIFNPEQRIQIMGENYRQLVYDTDPWHDYQRHYATAQALAPLDRHLFVDAKTWLVDDILVKIDRTTMAAGLEARCPYLDIDLVTYLATLPPHYKLAGFNGKAILKQALATTLPTFVRQRKKTGFNAPVSSWLPAQATDNEFQTFTRWVLTKKLPPHLGDYLS